MLICHIVPEHLEHLLSAQVVHRQRDHVIKTRFVQEFVCLILTVSSIRGISIYMLTCQSAPVPPQNSGFETQVLQDLQALSPVPMSPSFL